MKNKHSTKGRVLLTAAIALAVSATSGVALWKAPTTAETLTDLGGFLSYDATKVSVTEDASAVVPYVSVLSGGALQRASNGITTFTKLNTNQAQLDSGRSGLHIKTVASGVEAEGAGVNFTNTLSGDFSMDFRVFSEQTYYGKQTGSAAKNDVSTDYYNTFLDTKEIGVTIASTTTDDAFTIYVRGASLWGLTSPNARVWVKGETIENGNIAGLKGYGLQATDAKLNFGYPINTELKGNSFVNVHSSGYDTYTTLEFDVETMCVYAVTYTTTISSSGSTAVPSRVLIRDLSQYPTVSGSGYDKNTVKTLTDSDAFADGYKVAVEFTDVTANDTKLQTINWADPADEYHSGAAGTDVTDTDGNAVTYERYGNMLIYSLNGQSFTKNAGFKVESLATQTYTKWHDGTAVATTQYEARETGVSAEGASIAWKNAVTGAFEEEVCIRTWDEAELQHQGSSVGKSKINGGMGHSSDGAFAPFQVKEVAFDFVSKSDPTKTFTLFIRSGGGTWGNLTDPSARVYIPGDTVMTNDLEYGYGLTTGLSYCTYTASNAGKFDAELQSKLIGWMGGNTSNNSFGIKFDPAEMKVYGLVEASGTYGMIRDLANNSGTNVPTDNCASLSAADFEDGYYVTFRFTDVRRNDFTKEERIYNNNGTVTAVNSGRDNVASLTTASARVAFRYAAADALDVNVSDTASYVKEQPTAKISTLELGEENELKPVFFGVMSNGAAITGDIAFANGEHTGTIAATEGVYKFTPTTAGEYTFTYNVSWNGETIEYATKASAVDLYSALIFKNGDETVKTVTVENGKEITLNTVAPAVSNVGYTFAGWSDGETVYAANGAFTPETDVTFTAEFKFGDIQGATLTLGGELGVNFYVQLPETATTETATFAIGGNVVKTVNVADVENSANLYKFTYAIAPKDFRTEITLTVNGGAVKTYSAAAYLTTVMNDTTDAFTAKDKAIATATFNYCSIASKYFDGVATAVTVEDVAAADLAAYAHTISLNLPEGVQALGPRLVLESATELRIYFSASMDVSGVPCTVNGEAAEIRSRTDSGVTVYYIAVENIAAQDLDEMQEIKLGVDGAYASLSYSALSYVRSALLSETTSAELAEMVKALYHYAVAANTYFANN